jgi:WD40 repeat protein
MMVLDEETAGWQGDGVSVGFDASAEYHHIEQLKEQLVRLAARVEALREAEEKMASEREGVETEMAKVESELEAAVAAPASGGQDPTSWLPDELLILILLLLPFETLWRGQYTGVCRRWRTLGESGPVQRRKRTGKWEAYAKGWIQPRRLEGHNARVFCLAVGLGDSFYAGFYDGTVRVWSGGDEIRRLEGHSEMVLALAVGPDGTVYSGSYDRSIQVWSGEDGTPIRTLSGHRGTVRALAVAPNHKLYSGCVDKSIRVWSTLGSSWGPHSDARGAHPICDCPSFGVEWARLLGIRRRHDSGVVGRRWSAPPNVGRAHQLDHVVGVGRGREAVLGIA